MATGSRTLGQHLAQRLTEIGITHLFGVPGDFNLVLLDQFLKQENLTYVGCCNELNAGYAADGYARSRGVGVVCTTFTVGGLSVINAVAGAFSENLPLICITGGPNSNDMGTNRVLHHTIGLPDWGQEYRCFKEITCHQEVIGHMEDAHAQIDRAISAALRQRLPVYINICCNLAGLTHPTFDTAIPFSIFPKISNPKSLEAAVTAAADFLNAAHKPVLVAGGHLRSQKAVGAFAELVNNSGYATAAMVNAKGMVDEQHAAFIGSYWGAVSTAYAAEIVESADAYVLAGPIFNDYTTTGWSLLLKSEKMVLVENNSVTIGGAKRFNCCVMSEFLTALAGRIKQNPTAMQNYQRMYLSPPEVPRSQEGSPLLTKSLYHHIQGILSEKTSVLAETGDSWFNCQKLKLPTGCGYQFQCQYGSIGWSVGATLGYSIAEALSGKRVIASIGDGSFQVTAQDVTTMLKMRANPIIVIVNNGGYTIEEEIHASEAYNVIHNWDYVGLVRALDNGLNRSWATRVKTEDELVEALKQAMGEQADKLCLVEAIIHKDDCSKELLEWGSRVASTNARPPNPQ